MLKTVLASQNAHKAEEFAHAVNGVEVMPAPFGVDVDENADTFIGNACLKARAYASALGVNTLADDSGLCVDALGGAPGVHSQRYAVIPPDVDDDPDRTAANNRKLLRQLKGVASEDRTAYFACALCLCIVDPADMDKVRQNAVLREAARFYRSGDAACSAEDADAVRAEIVLEGRASGVILDAPAGDAGFGYDPLFFSPEAGCTFAQLTQAQKLAVSHRGRAIALLRALFDKAVW